MTTKKDLEAEVARLGAELSRIETLHQIALDLSTACTHSELLRSLADPAVAAGADAAILMHLYPGNEGDGPEDAMVVAAWTGDGRELEMGVGDSLYLPDIPLAPLWLGSTTEAQLVASVDQVEDEAREFMEHLDAGAMAAIPLFDTEAERWVGLLVFYWSHPHRFDEQEIAIYQALPALATPAVEARKWPVRLTLQVIFNASRPPLTLFRLVVTDGLEDDSHYVLAEDMGAAVRGVEVLLDEVDDADVYISQVEHLAQGVWITPGVAHYLLTFPLRYPTPDEEDEDEWEWEDRDRLPPLLWDTWSAN
jgi:hypothetical protein